MNQLVLHHTYRSGSTTDVSGFANHAVPTGATPAPPPDEGSYRVGVGRGIVVKQSPVLTRLGAIRGRMRFCQTGTDARRHNLIEGHGSFVVAIQPDRAVYAGLFADDGQWRYVSLPAATVKAGTWHTLEFAHDGIDRLWLRVDGASLTGSVPGPVRGVGPYGIGIGRWPDSSNYELDGFVGETQLWRYDPYTLLQDLLDPCCEPDDAALAALAEKVETSGADPYAIAAAVRDQQDDLMRLARTVRGATAGRAELDELVPALAIALHRPRRRGLPRIAERVRALVERTAGAARVTAHRQAADALAARLGLGPVDVRALLAAYCLGDLLPPDPAPDEPWAPADDDAGAPWNDSSWVPTIDPEKANG